MSDKQNSLRTGISFLSEFVNSLRNEISFLSELANSLRNGIPLLSEFTNSLRNGIPFLRALLLSCVFGLLRSLRCLCPCRLVAHVISQPSRPSFCWGAPSPLRLSLAGHGEAEGRVDRGLLRGLRCLSRLQLALGRSQGVG